jgi:rhamnogalacturonyl hydrolase YesR
VTLVREPEHDAAHKVERSAAAVARWVEQHGYCAYDPGDGNLSFLHPLTFNVLILERLLQQAVYRSPLNLRPLLGIKPHVSTKGMGYMAWGYVKLYASTGEPVYATRAKSCLDWLIANKTPFYPQYAWGNHFPFCTRGGKTPALEPIVPWTTLIGQAFIEAHAAFREPKYLEVIDSIADWLLRLPRERTESGTCISYVAFKQNSIHNSNMLAGAFLAQAARLTDKPGAVYAARDAMVYSCSRQRADGAWMYGAAAKFQWNDNFHTGYNLDCLKRYIDATGDRAFDANLRNGFEYFKTHFFEPDGRPKYYDNQTLPTDSQCAGQAIDTLTFFSGEDSSALPLAIKVANWTIDHMQDRDGHFYYRDLGWTMARTPMLHWAQGTIFKALTHLLGRLRRLDSGDSAIPARTTAVGGPSA